MNEEILDTFIALSNTNSRGVEDMIKLNREGGTLYK